MKKYAYVMALGLLSLGVVNAATKKAEKGAEPTKAAAQEDPKAKMMAEMQKLGAPSENHKVLDVFVGNWEHAGKAWMSPEEKPVDFKGTNVNKWILGKRFVEQRAKGQWMDQPFEGIGITGYDNMKGEYNMVWLDNMTTGLMTASSQYDAATKTFSEAGTFSCPMTGEKNKAYRAVTKIQDDDHYRYETFFKDKDGKEYKSMELQYERSKAASVPTSPENRAQ